MRPLSGPSPGAVPRRWLAACPLLALAVAGAGACGSDDERAAPGDCGAQGTLEACWAGPPAQRSIGACRDGQRTCQGGRWSACLGQVLPQSEDCSNALDDDCNGVADDGCPCEPGSPPRDCYSAAASTRDIGLCRGGKQSCEAGVWSTQCAGEVLPASEDCDGLDNDCNGLVDDGCGCSSGSSQPCYAGPSGTAGVGVCRQGLQQCVGGQWEPSCTGEVLPGAETCNGVDDDCDGQVDDDSFLPDGYDSLEWLEGGWLGLPDSAVLTWGGTLALWDAASSKVSAVMSLADAWNAVGTSGTQPPPSGVQSMLPVPIGVFGVTADTLWVAAGSAMYFIDTAAAAWQSAPISQVLGFVPNLAAMTIFRAGDLPSLTEDVAMLTDGAQIWLVGAQSGLNPQVFTVAQMFCPPATTGPCPPAITALSRLPGSPTASVLVAHNGLTYTSPILSDPNGALYYQWSTLPMSAISCVQ